MSAIGLFEGAIQGTHRQREEGGLCPDAIFPFVILRLYSTSGLKVKEVFREKDVLRVLSTKSNVHSNVMQLYCTFQDNESLYFVLTYAKVRMAGKAGLQIIPTKTI
jgi:hypothetical protein